MWRQRHKKRERNAYNEKASYLSIIAHFGVKVKENGWLVGGFFACIVVFGGSSGFGVGPDAGNTVIAIV